MTNTLNSIYNSISAQKAGFYPFLCYFDFLTEKFGDSVWDWDCRFIGFDLSTEYMGKIKSILGEEYTYSFEADNDFCYYGIDFPNYPLERYLSEKYKGGK